MLFQYGFLSVLGLSSVASAFQILGGYEAVDSLRPRVPTRPAHYMSEMNRREPEPNIFDERGEDVSSKNMRCGYVNGTCPTGYWYVNSTARSKNKSNSAPQLLNWRFLVSTISPRGSYWLY
jgi:hypothetical protein